MPATPNYTLFSKTVFNPVFQAEFAFVYVCVYFLMRVSMCLLQIQTDEMVKSMQIHFQIKQHNKQKLKIKRRMEKY